MEAFEHPAPVGPLLGFALFADAVDVDALAAALSDEIEGGVTRHTVTGEDGTEFPMLLVEAQGVTLLLGPVDAPVPQQDALAACHPLWWTDTEPVASHTAHLVLTVPRDPSQVVDRERVLHEAVMFSVVATIVGEQPGAVALFSGNAGACLPAEPFRKLVLDSLDEGRLPVEGWISVWLGIGEDGRIGGYTVGLPTFGHADLTIEDSAREASEVYGLLFSLASHLVTSGDLLTPGAFVGHGDDDRHEITAHFGGQGQPVLQIDY